MAERINAKQISGLTKLLAVNFTPASGGSVTTEHVLHALQVLPGQILPNNLIEVFAYMGWNNTAGTKNFKAYFSPTNVLTDPLKVQVMQSTSNTVNQNQMWYRQFPVLSDTTIKSTVPGTTQINVPDGIFAGTNIPTIITVPSLSDGFYILITGTKAVTTDTDTIDHSFAKVFT